MAEYDNEGLTMMERERNRQVFNRRSLAPGGAGIVTGNDFGMSPVRTRPVQPATALPQIQPMAQQPMMETPEVRASRAQWTQQEYARKLMGQGAMGVNYGTIQPAAAATPIATENANIMQGMAMQPPTPQTPQDYATAWNQENTIKLAGGGHVPANVLSGQPHPDTPFYTMDLSTIAPDTLRQYKAGIPAVNKIFADAMARRDEPFHSIKEAQDWAASLGVDALHGEYLERLLTNNLARSNPQLLAEYYGGQRAQEENMKSFAEYQAQNPGATQQDFLADPDAPKYQYDPVSGGLALKKPTKEQVRLKEERDIQRQADESGGQLVAIRGKTGKLELQDTDEIRSKRLDTLDKRRERYEKELAKVSVKDYILTPEQQKNMSSKEQVAEIERQRNMELSNWQDKINKIDTELAQIDRDNQIQTLSGHLGFGQPGYGQVPTMTPEQAMQAAPGTRFMDTEGNIREVPMQGNMARSAGGVGTITMGNRTVSNRPIATPTIPIAEETTEPQVSPEITPTNVSEQDTRRAELMAQAPEFSEADIANFAGRKIKEGVLTATDMAGVVGEKAAFKIGQLMGLPLKKGLDFIEWEKKIGRSAWNRLVIALEDKMREEWVNQQMAK